MKTFKAYVPMVRWVVSKTDAIVGTEEWKLVVGRGKYPRTVAIVWNNGVWHTFNRNGVGGENSNECDPVRAKVEAAASAIAQGFI